MGFFKRLFRTKEKKEPVTQLRTEQVKVEDLLDWFSKTLNARFEDVKEEVALLLKQVEQEKVLLNQGLDRLKTAKLRNPMIPHKALQIMEGNRESYINRSNLFIKRIAIPGTVDYKSCQEFCMAVEKELKNFGDSSARSFYLLKEFFNDEVSAIAKNIKNIDSSIKAINENVQNGESGTGLIENLGKDIEDFQKHHSLKMDFLSKVESEKAGLEKIEVEKQRIEKEIAKLRQSNDFRDLEKSKAKNQEIINSMNQLESEIVNLFSTLEAPLKKFARTVLEDEGLILEYIGSPVNALMNDKDLKIVSLLRKLKTMVLEDKIELKDKKKEKSLERIDEITKSMLNSFLLKYNELLQERNMAERFIISSSVLKNVQELEYRLDHARDKLERASADLDKLTKFHEKIDLDTLKQELQDKLKNATRIDVEVVLSDAKI